MPLRLRYSRAILKNNIFVGMIAMRQLEIEDYESYLVKWWNDWGWKAPAIDFLPDYGEGGLMATYNGVPVVAGFIYMTNSEVSWVDWIISDKKFSGNRTEVVKELVKALTNVAIASGSKYVYALIKHEGLIRTYEELGYVAGDSYNQEMIKVI